VALFGEPGSGKFEFVFTGRFFKGSATIDSRDIQESAQRRICGACAGAAFGGPIFYGHQAGDNDEEKPNHPGNAYWYQAQRANELFKALDGKQREVALRDNGRLERKTETVKLTGKKTGLDGIRVGDLSRDQKDLVRKVMADVLAPFRKADADESMKLIEKNGFENLHMAFYKNQDLGGDGVWDVWQIEGPAMVWFFRGEPHVHTWVHVRESASLA
jgi:hypothetical protein